MKATHLPAWVRAALAYFGVVFATGFALGVVRVTALVPRLGERAAELAEMPLMVAACALAARWACGRFSPAATSGQRLAIGLAALALLLGTELLLAYSLRDQMPTEALFDRDPVSGAAYFAALALFALMPRLLGERRQVS